MPPLKIIGKLTTRPFASDDLQILSLSLGIFRFLQFCCIVPLWIQVYVRKVVSISSIPYWCLQPDTHRGGFQGAIGILNNSTSDDDSTHEHAVTTIWATAYLFLSFAHCIIDLSILIAIWAAASVGTPTQPMKRDIYLRKLVSFKIFGLSIYAIVLVSAGILMVHEGRKNGYGCGKYQTIGRGFEDTNWYTLFSIILFTQAIEVFVLPAIVSGQIMNWIRKQNRIQLRRETTRRLWDGCLIGFFKCCRLLCCSKLEIDSSSGQMRDVSDAMLDFFAKDQTTDLELTLSDLYFSFRMLSRVQQQRRLEANNTVSSESKMESQSITTDNKYPSSPSSHPSSPSSIITTTIPENTTTTTTTEGVLETTTTISIPERRQRPGLPKKKGSIRILNRHSDIQNMDYHVTHRTLLGDQDQDTDIVFLQQAILYAKHSKSIYDHFYPIVKTHMKKSAMKPQRQNISLEEIGYPSSTLVYSNFVNMIDKTPYCIVTDLENKTVVLSIRGTASLEDAIIDLQLTPSDFGNDDGCFDSTFEGQSCHKGVLTRSKWIYHDLQRHKVLDELLLGEDSKCKGFELIVTGHSLGAGCAAITSCMLRQTSFPALRCFAFCCPGGLVSEGVADYCKDFVTCFVNNADIIPRMSLSNMERLRDEGYEVFTRIKLPKINLFRALRIPISEKDLERCNQLLLYSPEQVPKTTEFYLRLEEFRGQYEKLKESDSKRHTKLYSPGNIVYLVKSKVRQDSDAGIPEIRAQWADKRDFGEILLVSSLLIDHSIDCVIDNLESSILKIKTLDSMPMRIEEAVFDSELFERHATVLSERSVVCCSRPHGIRSNLAAFMSTIGLLLSLIFNNACDLVHRTAYFEPVKLDSGVTPNPTPGPVFLTGLGVSTGLYSYEKKVWDGVGPWTDPNSYVDANICSLFPSWFDPDGYLIAAWGCSTTLSVFGIVVITILWSASCFKVPETVWRAACLMLVLNVILQCLVFIFFFESSLCNTMYFPGSESQWEAYIYSSCSLTWQSNVGIAAAAFWLAGAIATVFYPKPNF